MHKTTSRFWKCFEDLPVSVQQVSKKNFKLLKADPLYSSLHFKKLGKFWSVRVGINHRALAIEEEQGFIWVWVGSHSEYERMLKKNG